MRHITHIEEIAFKLISKYKLCYKYAHIVFKNLKKYDVGGSIYEYCQKNKLIVKNVCEQNMRTCKKGATTREEYESYRFNHEIQRNVTEQYIACVENAIISGQNEGIFLEGKYLSDRVLYDDVGFHRFLPQNMRMYKNNCLMWNMSIKDEPIDKGIFLLKMWSWNYFHFVFEAIARISEIDEEGLFIDYPLLLDEIVKKDPRNLELIDKLNIHSRKIIWISEGEYIKINKLVIPPITSWGVWDVKKSLSNTWGYVIDNKAAKYIRETILSGFCPEKRYKCVYISRGNNLRLTNESEIIDFFIKQGFDIFNPDKATFKEELECFSTADCIVLCAGGASTNLIFCKQDVDIFCILPYEFRVDSPIDITSTINVIPYMCDAEMIYEGEILAKSQFSFPIEKCQQIVWKCKKNGLLEC